jgi:acyl-coenzyme A synthetase/AMP-(fatty) acid ligase
MFIPDAKRFDLSSLEILAYSGSPLSVELYRRTRRMLPGVKLVQLYGMTETGFLTGLDIPSRRTGMIQ